jgi:hypothetical protein
MSCVKSTATQFGILLLAALSAFGQKPKTPTGPAPRLADGKPDLNGVWERPYVPDVTKNGPGQQGVPELSFTAWGADNWKSYDPAKNGDYTGSCLPFGLLRSMNSPHPMQIVQSAKYVAFLYEQNTWFHVVPVDGREHPKGVEPTWFGNSVGNWDGDKLVVDTIGFNGQTRLDTIGHPHSDALHVVETLERADAGHITYTVTVDDPKTYTKSWKNVRTFTLRPDWELLEYSCEENNKDLRDGHIKAPTFGK